MKQDQRFIEDYKQAAHEFLCFLSYGSPKSNYGFHKFHRVGAAMRIEQILGMPWRINLPDNPTDFGLTGIRKSEISRTGEFRFCHQDANSPRLRKILDNCASEEAPRILAHVRGHIRSLRKAIDPTAEPSHVKSQNWQPSIRVDDNPSPAEQKERLQRALAQRNKLVEFWKNHDEFYTKIIVQHDCEKITGRHAFYTDIQMLIQSEKKFNDKMGIAYFEWLENYVSEKIKGQEDKDILPLPLNYNVLKR